MKGFYNISKFLKKKEAYKLILVGGRGYGKRMYFKMLVEKVRVANYVNVDGSYKWVRFVCVDELNKIKG